MYVEKRGDVSGFQMRIHDPEDTLTIVLYFLTHTVRVKYMIKCLTGYLGVKIMKWVVRDLLLYTEHVSQIAELKKQELGR